MYQIQMEDEEASVLESFKRLAEDVSRIKMVIDLAEELGIRIKGESK